MDYPKCLIGSANFWPQLFAPGNEIHRKYLEIPKHCVKSHLDIHTSKSFTYFYIQHFMKKTPFPGPAEPSPPWRPAQSDAVRLEPSPQTHPFWNTALKYVEIPKCGQFVIHVYIQCVCLCLYISLYIYIYLVIYLFIVNWAFSVDPCANPNLLIRSEWFCRMGCRLKWLQKHMASAFSSVGSAGGLEPAVDGGLLHVDLLDNEMLYIKWECVLWCSLHPIRTPHACF